MRTGSWKIDAFKVKYQNKDIIIIFDPTGKTEKMLANAKIQSHYFRFANDRPPFRLLSRAIAFVQWRGE